MDVGDVNIGQVLLVERVITQADLTEALAQQQAHPDKKIGEILVAMGKLTQATLDACLKKQTVLRKQGASKADANAAMDFAMHDTNKISQEIDTMIEELSGQVKR